MQGRTSKACNNFGEKWFFLLHLPGTQGSLAIILMKLPHEALQAFSNKLLLKNRTPLPNLFTGYSKAREVPSLFQYNNLQDLATATAICSEKELFLFFSWDAELWPASEYDLYKHLKISTWDTKSWYWCWGIMKVRIQWFRCFRPNSLEILYSGYHRGTRKLFSWSSTCIWHPSASAL